mmetsp:Transcript_24032/g.33695  ORF Transcript_24032/g.33695 Transcript_24032/m.33695 type:complete len:147 (+) Transcript_24032:87-527(+)
MSWDAYITNLTGQGLVHAAIYGLAGGKWAQDASFALNDQQVNAFIQSVNQNKAAENGFSAPASMNQENKENPSASIKAGQVVKFTYINKIEDNGIVVYVFKKGPEGIAVGKTNKAWVIGQHNDKVSSPKAVEVVQKITKYLVDSGY